MTGRTRLLTSIAVVLGALAVPSTALAAEFYVDRDTGGGVACTQAAPCATIADGIAAAGVDDEIRVDDSTGAYLESVELEDGKSLVEFGFVGGVEGDTIIDGGATMAIDLDGPVGTIRGFNIRGDQGGILANAGDATITQNTFDEPVERGFADVLVQAAGTVSISQNTFTAPAGDTLSNGVSTDDGTNPVVTDNSFSGYAFSVNVDGAGNTTEISGNAITGSEGGHALAAGIFAGGESNPTITANSISQSNGGPRGIYIKEDTANAVPTGATLSRNQVVGMSTGVEVEDTTGAVTLDSDLIVDSGNTGLHLRDPAPTGTGEGDVGATNVTLADNVTDILNDDATLTLDSSIVEDAIGVGGGPNCIITFSRGPSTTPGGTGCADFQTTAAPGFANPAGGDYRLTDGSAMVDAGNPAAPTQTLDYNGESRLLDGDLNGTARRDIGADELMPRPQLTGTDPPSPNTDTTPNVLGLAEATATGTSVKLFASGNCTGPIVASGSAAQLASPGIATPIAQINSTTTYSARVQAPTGTSTCSVVNVAYVHDTLGPTATIVSAPPATSSDNTPTVGFSSGEPGATFECRVDTGPFAPCASPATFGPLTDGTHTIAVRAVDGLGNPGPAAFATFTIDTGAPGAVTITGPAKKKLKRGKKRVAVSFDFSSEAGASFECSLDGAGFAPCTPPHRVRLRKGRHTLEVRATDVGGNVGPVATKAIRVKKPKSKRRG